MVSSGRGFSCEVFFNASVQKMAIFLSAFASGTAVGNSLTLKMHSLPSFLFRPRTFRCVFYIVLADVAIAAGYVSSSLP